MMMKHSKKLGLFMLVFLLLVITACGKDTEKEEKPDKAADGVTELSFIAYSNYEAPLESVIEQFEKENDTIKVKLELAPFDQLMETIEIKMGSKSEDVDILFVDSPLTTNYAVKGYLTPLDDLFSANPRGQWVDSANDSVTFQDELIAAPMNSSSQVLYLNKAIFEENNVPLPAEDERMTWEELIALAEQLTQDTNNDGINDVFGFSFDQIDRAYQLLALSDSMGVDMISENGITTDGFVNSPEAVEAYQLYYDLFNTYKVSPQIKREESIDYFLSGKVAMFLGANHNLPKLRDSSLDFAVSLHPYFEGKEIATPTGAWNLGISAYSKNKEAAGQFIEYLTAGEGAKIMFEVGGTLPVNLDLLDFIETDESYNAFPDTITRIAAKESRETAVARPKTPGYLEWETNMNRAFEDIKNGTKPQDALNSAVDQIDRLLKKYEDVVK